MLALQTNDTVHEVDLFSKKSGVQAQDTLKFKDDEYWRKFHHVQRYRDRIRASTRRTQKHLYTCETQCRAPVMKPCICTFESTQSGMHRKDRSRCYCTCEEHMRFRRSQGCLPRDPECSYKSILPISAKARC